MKAVIQRVLFLLLLCNVFSIETATANGCTGTRFEVVYSPWCGCWQVCGNYISDCDELVSVSFNFGDGTPSTSAPNPCHTYAQPGVYTVTMTVVAYCHGFLNLFTTTCHITRTVNVVTTGPVLIAGFTADTTCLGTSTTFTNTTIAPAGSNNTYTWIFGDGTIGRGPNPTHTYDTCGAYDVMMIVTNSAPCCPITGSDTIIHRVYVNCAPFDNSNGLGSTDPYIEESDAQIVVTSGTCAGDTTRFNVSYNGPIDSLLWTFPDSTTSTSRTPWYIYPACPPAIPYTATTCP
ncbi:MAG: PKD domain-containing protein [Bacteroidota bacterium]